MLSSRFCAMMEKSEVTGLIPHILLRNRKKEYLLIQDEKFFHIIDQDENLTEEKRRLILEQCPTPAQMQELGLSGMTISKSDLEGVAVYGVATGDELVFLLGKKKLRYQLARRYEQKRMDDFFRGIPRAATPARRQAKSRKHRDWRISEQDPVVRKRMGTVHTILNWFSGAVAVAMMAFGEYYDLLSVFAVVCSAAAVYLGVVHQEYFTFMSEKEYKKQGGCAQVLHWWLPYAPLALVFLRNYRRFVLFDVLALMGYGLVIGIVIGLLIVLFTEDLKRNIGTGFAVVFASVILCTGIVGQGNHILATNPFVMHSLPVVDMYIDSGSRRSPTEYNCIVQFPDGRELTVDVGSRAEYEKYQVGDTLIIPIRTGAFGIEYGIYGYEK